MIPFFIGTLLSFQVEQMQNQVQDKEEENSALQREMSDARRKHEEATQVMSSHHKETLLTLF